MLSQINFWEGVVRIFNDKDDLRKLGSNVLPSCNGILIAKEMW